MKYMIYAADRDGSVWEVHEDGCPHLTTTVGTRVILRVPEVDITRLEAPTPGIAIGRFIDAELREMGYTRRDVAVAECARSHHPAYAGSGRRSW